VASGRVELAVFSTLYGLWVGGATFLLLVPDDATDATRWLAFSVAAGGAVGHGGTLALTKDEDVSEGDAALIEASTLWASWNAGALGLAQELDERPWVGTTLGVGLAGYGLGAYAASRTDLDSGDVALANTFGLWSGYGAMLLALEGDVEFDETLLGMVVGSDAGLALGAALAPSVRMSRSRLRLIDLGGVLGTLGLPAIVRGVGGDVSPSVFLGGAAAGLAAATGFTRDWDDVRTPRDEGAMLLAPRPTVLVARDGSAAPGLAIGGAF
jgi:hypothetical protein